MIHRDPKPYTLNARIVNLNGKLLPLAEAGIPVEDRSYRYGYGLFETMLVLDGVIRHEERHWARLAAGLAMLRFELPVRYMDRLRTEAQRCIARNGATGALRLRLQVSAGSGGYFDAADWSPFFLIECWPMPDYDGALNENGLVLGISGSVKDPGPYSALKSSNAFCYALAAREAKRAGWNDALLCNTAGNIVESCISNIFVQLDDRILTPPLSDGCVAGVMRGVLIDGLTAAGIPVYEESISPKVLPSVEGVILTNSLRGIRWAKSIENMRFTPDFALKALPRLS